MEKDEFQQEEIFLVQFFFLKKKIILHLVSLRQLIQ